MNKMSQPEVMWLCTCTELPVGIVRQYDGYEGRWKYYIGTGMGRDIDKDVQLILDFGQKFYSLDFLLDFAGRPPVIHCHDCCNYIPVNARHGVGICTHFGHEMPANGFCSVPLNKTKENEQ